MRATAATSSISSGRDAVHHGEERGVHHDEDRGVEQAERALVDDPRPEEEGRDQPDHLRGVFLVELDRLPEALLAAAPTRDRVDEPDHRPAEPGEQPQRAGEVGGHERHVLVPGDHGLDRELGQHLDPREQRQRQSLGDVELGGLGPPGHHEGAGQDGRECPDRLGGGALGFFGADLSADHAGLRTVSRR
jgi:hypothetical protein